MPAKNNQLKPDAEILKLYCEGKSLTAQYVNGDWTRKAYMTKNWKTLNKMIENHARFSKE